MLSPAAWEQHCGDREAGLLGEHATCGTLAPMWDMLVPALPFSLEAALCCSWDPEGSASLGRWNVPRALRAALLSVSVTGAVGS